MLIIPSPLNYSILRMYRWKMLPIVAFSFHHLLIWSYPLFPTQYHTDFISKTCECPAAERTCSFQFLWTSNYKSCKTKLLVLHIFMPESTIKHWFRYHSNCSSVISLFLITFLEVICFGKMDGLFQLKANDSVSAF